MTSAPTIGIPARRPSNREAKRLAIVDAAKRAFLRDGYERTSVDTIAELAGVSKQTIYNHGEDKESLFLQVVAHLTEHCATEAVVAIQSAPANPDNLAEELHSLAVALNQRVLDPDAAAFRPLIIAEAHRNPERGRLWATRNLSPMMNALAERLQELVESGRLAIDDPRTAADQFFALTTYQADRLTLNGVHNVSIADLETGVRSSIAMFLSAYAPSKG
jgi:TetR/AcrR family transcriptional regulator, mexJK operon transcriptional repressor